jgi:integrase
MLCGAARPDHRQGHDRGGAATDLPHPPGPLGATRVRPHRLRHTFGTELAAAGIDLLVLRDLMGHASPETTAGYVHLSPEMLAAEYAKARAGAR